MNLAPIASKLAEPVSCVKLADIPLGLMINVNVKRLVGGVSRLILPGANSPN